MKTDTIIIRSAKDWDRAISDMYSLKESEEIHIKFEPPEGKPGDVIIGEWFCAPVFHG